MLDVAVDLVEENSEGLAEAGVEKVREVERPAAEAAVKRGEEASSNDEESEDGTGCCRVQGSPSLNLNLKVQCQRNLIFNFNSKWPTLKLYTSNFINVVRALYVKKRD